MVKDAIRNSDLLEEAGDLGGAIKVLSWAISTCPDEPWLLARRGLLFKNREQWRKAIADFDTALSLKPDAPTTLFLRGVCRATIGAFDQAIADFENCIRLKPEADAYLQIGIIHKHRKNIPLAIEAWSKALELGPEEYPGLEDMLGDLQRQLEKR